MRSRYTAYVEHNHNYVLATWHPATRPASVDPTAAIRWLGLQIRGTTAGGESDTEGTVEFTARLRVKGRGDRLRETSRFVREQGRWYYLGPVAVSPDPDPAQAAR